MAACSRYAYVPYQNGWPIGVCYTVQEAADVLGCSWRSAWWYTTKQAHEKADSRKNGGRLIMRVLIEKG